MPVLNVKAFEAFGKYIQDLQKAIDLDDHQKQLVALTQAIDALQTAKQSMTERRGGILN